MKSKYFALSFATIAVLSLIAGVGLLAQDRPPQRLSGLTNDRRIEVEDAKFAHTQAI